MAMLTTARGMKCQFDAYPMPQVDELLDRLGTAPFFTMLDLTHGYSQSPFLQSARKMAFSTLYCMYQFVILLFGLFRATATLQPFMDDIIHRHTWVEHVYWVAMVLESPSQAGFQKKRVVGQREI